MGNTGYLLAGVLVMAVVTYLPRVLPLTIFRKKLENRFIKSFLHYMPYAVLSAMTFPSILYATNSVWSGLAGLAVAVILSFLRLRLLPVAVASTGAVILTELLMGISYF